MLPSPGFSIPSIGTPLHQPEEDQQILPHAQQQQQHQQPIQMPSLVPLSNQSIMQPNKTPTFMPSGFTTPQSLMQPQTPVRTFFYQFLPYHGFKITAVSFFGAVFKLLENRINE